MNWIWEFIKRNIFTIVIIVTLIVAMPWLGYLFVVPLVFIVAFGAVISWRIYKLRKQIYNEMHRQEGNEQQGWQQRQRGREEGKVTIVQTEQSEQKISDDVGEYVDFKEVKNKEK